MRVVAVVMKAMISASIASKIMLVGGVVRESGADGDEGNEISVDSVNDHFSTRRGPCGWWRW